MAYDFKGFELAGAHIFADTFHAQMDIRLIPMLSLLYLLSFLDRMSSAPFQDLLVANPPRC